jgi:hypothetical protein
MSPSDREPAGTFDLKALLPAFTELGKLYLGSPKMADLEDLFLPLRVGAEPFAMKHLELLQDRDRKHWSFLTFWKVPAITDADLEPLKGAFKGLRRKGTDKALIEGLFAVLKNIEVVSCLLRFVEPANYAIMSPPVENLLSTRGSTPTGKYFNYLADLHELKDAYGFERIADVDMALWALARILSAEDLKRQYPYSEAYEAYKKTSNRVKTLMARNALAGVYDNEPIVVARLFLDTDPILAGMIAGRLLELALNSLCRANGITLKKQKDGKLTEKAVGEKLRDLKDKRIISTGEENELDRAWEVRCACTHPLEGRNVGKELPAKDDIRWMIDRVAAFVENYRIILSLETQYLSSAD